MPYGISPPRDRKTSAVSAKEFDKIAEKQKRLGLKGQDYALADESWLRAKEPRKAIISYEKAATAYEQYAANLLDIDATSNRHRINYAYSEAKKMERKVTIVRRTIGKRGIRLEDRAAITVAIIGLVGGLFFLSANITGNVISINQYSSSWVGIILIIFGIVGSFFWIKRNKK